MKKIISLVLVLALVLSLSVTTAFADNWKDESGNKLPPGLSKGGGLPPGIAKKIFDDIDNFSWAEKAIEKMTLKGLIKGYGNGQFKPGYPVSKLEAVIMALRIMGWEEEAKDIYKLPEKYSKKKVDEWAVGYVTLAYEKGILDDVDMMYFNPKEPVKRHEVAKYVIRALGYEDKAQEHMDEELPFVDAAAVPTGSVGYVYLVNEMGLMQGDNQKRFNPMGTMTRAEMAVLFARLDDKVDSDVDVREVTGEIFRLNEDTIALKIKGYIKLFKVSEKVRVYDGRDRIDYEDLKPGTKVVMELQDNEVVFIEILNKEDKDKIITRYSGIVINIKTDDTRTITVKAETMTLIFEVIDDVKVKFEDGEGNFDEIKTGDEVSILVDTRNRAREIHVHREREHIGWDDEIEGVITDLDLIGIYHISIDNREYSLDEEAEVLIDGEEAELTDLQVGMEVEAELEDNIVIKIEAESIEIEEIEGVIDELDLIGVYHITIDGKEYGLDEEAEVLIDGEEAELADLQVGMEVEAKLEDNIVIKIEAESIEIKEVKGIIDQLDLIGTYHITIDGKEYDLDEEAEVKVDGEEAELYDLKIGMKVEAELKDNIIVKIDADTIETVFEGEIVSIVNNVITIEKKDNTRVTYQISKDVKIEIEGIENADIKDLSAGDYGRFEVVNNLIVEIKIDNEVDEVKGSLISINDKKIKINVDDEELEYNLDDKVKINYEGRIEEKDDNKIIAVGTVIHRNVESGFYQVAGYRLTGSIDFSKYEGKMVKIEGTIDESPSIYMTKAIKVKRLSLVSPYSVLLAGMKIELKVKDNTAYEVIAEDNRFEVEGEITIITKTTEGIKLTIKTEDNDLKEYFISEDAEIEIEDVNDADVEDLKIGQEGEFEVVNNLIIRIDIDN